MKNVTFKKKCMINARLKGRCKKVHFTLDTNLGTKLIGAFLQSFSHFVLAETPNIQGNRPIQSYKGPRVGLSKDHYRGQEK